MLAAPETGSERERETSHGAPMGAPAVSGANASNVYAAIDLGTNNCRLLVARPSDGGFKVIDSFSRIVRLGEGLDASGRLSRAAMDRTLAALHVCANKMHRQEVTRLRNVATEACRRADNCAYFVERVLNETGLDIEIISSRDEARLALDGCVPLLDETKSHALLFDIGGGSTELMWVGITPGEAPTVLGWMSMPWGVVSLAERHAHLGVPAGFAAMIEHIHGLLAPFEAAQDIARIVHSGHAQMLGTSGTVTTLAGVHLGLRRYERAKVDGMVLGFEALTAVSDRLVAMDRRSRANQPCIGRDRVDFVVAGCAILAAICRLWPVGRLRVADRGLREGILLRLMREDQLSITGQAPCCP